MGIEMTGVDYQEVTKVDSSFGGEKVDIIANIDASVSQFSRRYCLPDATIYKDDPVLKNNPLEAVKHIKIENGNKLIKDTETAIVAEIAKLQTAEDNLKLNPKQKEVFEEYKENQKGALAWISGMAGAIPNPDIRRRVINTTVATLEVLGLAACGAKGLTPPSSTEITPTESPVVEMTELPTAVATDVSIKKSKTAETTQKVDIYAVDEEKVHNFPSSSADVLSNPEKYQQAPDGIADPQALLDWFDTYKEYNGFAWSITNEAQTLEVSAVQDWNALGFEQTDNSWKFEVKPEDRLNKLNKSIEFFYFIHNSEVYMVPVISIHNAEKDLDPENRDIPTTLGKWAIILGPNEGYDVDEIIKGISNGDMIESIEVYKKIIPQMSNEAKTMIDGGVDCHETWGNFIGVGTIDMVK